jgi:hypothetical protein
MAVADKSKNAWRFLDKNKKLLEQLAGFNDSVDYIMKMLA